jgi:hypothetical protein
MSEHEQILFNAVFTACESNPSMVAPILDAASAGVKSFAEKQSDRSSALVVRLVDVINNTPNWSSRSFSKKDILSHILPHFKDSKYGDAIEREIKNL